MVFIVYGWANKRRGIAGELEAGHCEGCGTSRGFRKRVTYKVRHISWLVRWVTERRYERVCETCGRGEWISPKIMQQGLKRPGIPIWDRYGWAGSLAAVALLLTTAFMADEADHRRYDALLAAPAAGDLYEIDLAQVVQRPPMPTMKAIVKVDRVEGGQVVVRLPKGFYDGPSKDLDDAIFPGGAARSADYFTDQTLSLERAELTGLHKAGTIWRVMR